MQNEALLERQSLITTLSVPHGREKEAAAFYQDAMGASALREHRLPSGEIYAIDLEISGSVITVAGANPRRDRGTGLGPRSPESVGSTTCSLVIRVDDADAALRRAVSAGGFSRGGVDEALDGGRGAGFTDPFGHVWGVFSTR